MAGTKCIVSDAHKGLKCAIASMFPEALWQRCTVHLMRYIRDRINKKEGKELAMQLLSQTFQHTNPASVRESYHQTINFLEEISPSTARLLAEAENDALAYLQFPEDHYKGLRTNNIQERDNLEIKRRTKVISAFPSTESMLKLAGAVMMDEHEKWAMVRNINQASMSQLLNGTYTVDETVPINLSTLIAEEIMLIKQTLELKRKVS